MVQPRPYNWPCVVLVGDTPPSGLVQLTADGNDVVALCTYDPWPGRHVLSVASGECHLGSHVAAVYIRDAGDQHSSCCVYVNVGGLTHANRRGAHCTYVYGVVLTW